MNDTNQVQDKSAKPRSFSHSSLSCYRGCPRKYELIYVAKGGHAEKVDTVELFLGKRVHECLEALYLEASKGNLWTLSSVLGLYTLMWQDKWHSGIKIVRREKPMAHYKELGIKCLTDYYNRFYPFNQNKLLSVEQRIKIKIADSTEFKMGGVVDRIDEINPTHLEVHDYKTGNKMPSQKDCDEDRQLATYALGVLDMYPNVENVTLVWHYLQHDKDMVSTRTKEQLQQLKASLHTEINQVLEAIRNKAFPTKPSYLCKWCEVRHLCPDAI
jgi:putative RecB family exonuclease